MQKTKILPPPHLPFLPLSMPWNCSSNEPVEYEGIKSKTGGRVGGRSRPHSKSTAINTKREEAMTFTNVETRRIDAIKRHNGTNEATRTQDATPSTKFSFQKHSEILYEKWMPDLLFYLGKKEINGGVVGVARPTDAARGAALTTHLETVNWFIIHPMWVTDRSTVRYVTTINQFNHPNWNLLCRKCHRHTKSALRLLLTRKCNW